MQQRLAWEMHERFGSGIVANLFNTLWKGKCCDRRNFIGEFLEDPILQFAHIYRYRNISQYQLMYECAPRSIRWRWWRTGICILNAKVRVMIKKLHVKLLEFVTDISSPQMRFHYVRKCCIDSYKLPEVESERKNVILSGKFNAQRLFEWEIIRPPHFLDNWLNKRSIICVNREKQPLEEHLNMVRCKVSMDNFFYFQTFLREFMI